MPDTFTPEQISQILEEFFKVVGTRQYIGARYVPIFGRKDEESIEWDNTAPYEPLTIVLYQGNSYTSRQFVPVGVEITNQNFWAITGNYNAQVEQYRRETAAAREIAEAAQNDIDTLLPKADFSAENTVKKYIDDSVAEVQNDIDTLLPKADFSAENTVKKYIDDSVAGVQNDIDTLLPKADFSAENTVKQYIDRNKTRVLSFDTVADMQNASYLESGMVCHTNGFHASGDGGAAYYTVSATGTANGMDVLTLQNGLFATLVVTTPYVTLEQLGAYGNDTNDDTDVIQYAVSNYLNVEGAAQSVYKVTSEIKVIRDYQRIRLNKIVGYGCSCLSFAGGWQDVVIDYVRAYDSNIYPAIKMGYENGVGEVAVPCVQLGHYQFKVAVGKNALDIYIKNGGYVNGNVFDASELVGADYSISITFESKPNTPSYFNQNRFNNISFETSANGIYVNGGFVGVNKFSNLRLNEMYLLGKEILHVENSSVDGLVIESSIWNRPSMPDNGSYYEFFNIINPTAPFDIELNNLTSSTGGHIASRWHIRRNGITQKACIWPSDLENEVVYRIQSDEVIDKNHASPSPFGQKTFALMNTANEVNVYLDAPYGYEFNNIKFIVPKGTTIMKATIYVKNSTDEYVPAYVIPNSATGKVYQLDWIYTQAPTVTITEIA